MTSIMAYKSPNTIWPLGGLCLVYDGRISSKLGRFLIVSSDGDARLGRLTEPPPPQRQELFILVMFVGCQFI